MTLTDTALRHVKSTDKQQKLFDGGGLFLLVSPSGTKSWRLKYRFQGKEKLLTLGQYPAIALKDARERAIQAKKLLANEIDPSADKKRNKLTQRHTFEYVAREWHQKQAPKWGEGYSAKVLCNLEKSAFPYIGSRPVTEVTGPELLAVLRRLEARGTIAQAHAVSGLCGAVFRYAVACGIAERDPSADIRGALTAHVRKHFPAITEPDKVGELLLKIDEYWGMAPTRCALQLLALTFCRPGEVRKAEWSEFDFADKLWRIPAAKMKMSRDHLVPLSRQAVAVLDEMRLFSDHARYVFVNQRSHLKPIGIYSLVSALRILGYERDEMCAHSFRAMASTLLNEQGYPADAIERQLAHVPHERIRGIYNRAEYLPERKIMLQGWADYLDSLRARAKQKRIDRLAATPDRI
jgi:integrase